MINSKKSFIGGSFFGDSGNINVVIVVVVVVTSFWHFSHHGLPHISWFVVNGRMNFVLEFERISETSRKYPISDDVRRGDAEPLRRPQDRFSFSWKYFSCFSQKKCPRSWKYCFFHRTFQTLNISISMTLLKLLSLQGFILPFKNLNTYVCRRTHRRRNPWSPLVS